MGQTYEGCVNSILNNVTEKAVYSYGSQRLAFRGSDTLCVLHKGK